MVNTDFVSRLQLIISHYEMSSASFADKIGVPRSSISHLLSQRNKPSLDFVMKVVKTFPEINLYWLLNGKGSFPSEKNISSGVEAASSSSHSDSFSEQPTTAKNHRKPPSTSISSFKQAIKVIVLYNDGSFDSFDPPK
ncbi:MAG: helix-turn-helix domain-containing protein [Croceitalea sp.]|nr:helix-turn-helix domain-containing protein [Croceitalea sp.]